MYKKLTRTALSVALAGALLTATGCELPRGGSYGGSYTDVFFGLDWLPGFGGYDYYDGYETYEYYEEDVFVVDTGGDYYYDDYYVDDYYYDEGLYFEDEYWDDGYWDDWKKKRSGRRK